MEVIIALAGNPNCGKTTMFNDLTGSSQYVGNWPGVTVEKKEGKLKSAKDITITDLPGIYSLSPYTPEEVVSRNYLLRERPDIILDLVDASNIERNLYLTTQLMETGIPVVVALNMMDIVKKRGDSIDTKALGEALGCQIVETSAVKNQGSRDAVAKAVALEALRKMADGRAPKEQERWYAVKLFERDQRVMESFLLTKEERDYLEEVVGSCEKDLDDDSESIITDQRYRFIGELVKKCVHKKYTESTPSDKIDNIVTNRWLALPVFAAVMFLVYFVSVSWLGAQATQWTSEVFFGLIVGENAKAFLTGVGTAPWLVSLICDGVIGGVGAILSFVPQMLLLFLFLSFLEDCGYMSRVAFIMDRIFRKFGLSGKSFIPMLVSSGCGVPGIMASRTIENDKDRRMTIIVTTFIPCGAKLPMIALIAAAVFRQAWWVGPAAYFLGIFMVALSGLILKKTRLFSGSSAPFVMELPQYHLPGLKNLLLHVWERGKSFVIKAGTVIFLACIVVWFLNNFGVAGGSLRLLEEGDSAKSSLLAGLGSLLAPVFAPLGFGRWETSVATLTGLVAKEQVVSTLGVILAVDQSALAGAVSTVLPTALSAISFLLFNLFCAPCLAAVSAVRREMGNWRWTFIAVGYQTALAYGVCFLLYQLGSLFLGGGFGLGALCALALLAAVLYLLLRRDPNRVKDAKKAAASV